MLNILISLLIIIVVAGIVCYLKKIKLRYFIISICFVIVCFSVGIIYASREELAEQTIIIENETTTEVTTEQTTELETTTEQTTEATTVEEITENSPFQNEIDVYMNIEPIIENGKIGFNLETNLPNSSKISANLKSDNNLNYNATANNLIIENGKCSFNSFTNKGENLSNGTYKLKVYLLSPVQQSKSVKAIIGESYENLTGDLIINDNGLSVEKTITITLNDSSIVNNSNDNLANHKQLLKTLYSELISECNSQLINYNEIEFAKFLSEWNTKRNNIQKTFDDENANEELNIALKDLIYLQTELKNKVMGKQYDENYIKNTMEAIETIIQ